MELKQIPQDSKDLLKGKLASEMNDVIARNWCIRFVNCQAMLKVKQITFYWSTTYMVWSGTKDSRLHDSHCGPG